MPPTPSHDALPWNTKTRVLDDEVARPSQLCAGRPLVSTAIRRSCCCRCCCCCCGHLHLSDCFSMAHMRRSLCGYDESLHDMKHEILHTTPTKKETNTPMNKTNHDAGILLKGTLSRLTSAPLASQCEIYHHCASKDVTISTPSPSQFHHPFGIGFMIYFNLVLMDFCQHRRRL